MPWKREQNPCRNEQVSKKCLEEKKRIIRVILTNAITERSFVKMEDLNEADVVPKNQCYFQVWKNINHS